MFIINRFITSPIDVSIATKITKDDVDKGGRLEKVTAIIKNNGSAVFLKESDYVTSLPTTITYKDNVISKIVYVPITEKYIDPTLPTVIPLTASSLGISSGEIVAGIILGIKDTIKEGKNVIRGNDGALIVSNTKDTLFISVQNNKDISYTDCSFIVQVYYT